MTTADQVLARARTQLGVAEDPPGSNQVPYSAWYGVDGPWCGMFVSWCSYEEGLPLPASTPKGFAYTPAGAAWFQDQGRWTTEPAPGHVVFFDFPGDDIDRISHVGFVEEVAADGTLTTIEGNTDEQGGRTGGQVMRRLRRSGIVGFGVPAYETGPGVDPSPEPELEPELEPDAWRARSTAACRCASAPAASPCGGCRPACWSWGTSRAASTATTGR